MIHSISPVELRFKEFPEDNSEQLEKNKNEQTETDVKEDKEVDINTPFFNHENVPEVN